MQMFVLTSILLSLLNGASGAGCFDDEAKCLQDLKTIMASETAFWFGTDYATQCPNPVDYDILCKNPDPLSRSVMNRLFSRWDTAQQNMAKKVATTLKLAKVTITAPEGEYYGCEHSFKVGANTFNLDPTKLTKVNSWSLDQKLSVTWDQPNTDKDSLYTVMVWDIGNYLLHGLYINAKGGNIETAEVVKAYEGPANPLPLANAYLFGVFKQTRKLDFMMIYASVVAVQNSNVNTFPAAAFFSVLPGLYSELTAANLMAIQGDGYSMERQKVNNWIDSCPYLLSQQKLVANAFKGAGFTPKWSSEVTTLDTAMAPFISTLTMNVMVEYDVRDDLVVDSCCSKTTFPRTRFRADPLGDWLVTPAITRAAPVVRLSPINIQLNDAKMDQIKEQFYTLMLVDVQSAIVQEDPFLDLHWMVTNIQGGDVNTGDQTIPYFGPNPFKANSPRIYMFLVLKQTTTKLDVSRLATFFDDANCPPLLKMRCRLNLPNMLNALDLKEVVGLTWVNVVQDAFARMRVYDVIKAKTQQAVCTGIPGYTNPCPAT